MDTFGHKVPHLSVSQCPVRAPSKRVTDWFWVASTDAYDWVVEPYVLGMGTFAAGDLMTTKPYVSGTPNIPKMSNYCDSCAFDPK
jgi:deoxyribodipyrimidine photolyase-related protein